MPLSVHKRDWKFLAWRMLGGVMAAWAAYQSVHAVEQHRLAPFLFACACAFACVAIAIEPPVAGQLRMRPAQLHAKARDTPLIRHPLARLCAELNLLLLAAALITWLAN